MATATIRRLAGFSRLLPWPLQRSVGRSSFSSTAMASSKRPHHERSFPALFVRGGTSNGLMVHEDNLPQWRAHVTEAASGESSRTLSLQAKAKAWSVLAPAMGAPDPVYRRELDGMGGGISSTSKVCVLAKSQRADADVDFTFVQVGVKDGKLDLAGNCGNMISAVGPIAFDWGLAPSTTAASTVGEKSGEDKGSTEAKSQTLKKTPDTDETKKPVSSSTPLQVRIYNTNTGKVIHSRFSTAGSPPRYNPDGDYAIDGVAGTHSKITLSFLRPAGAKTGAPDGLPTGRPVDVLEIDGDNVDASLVDVSNPGVFVRGMSMGFGNDTKALAAAIESDPDLKARVERIRQAGAAKMGLDPETESVPKIVFLFPPKDADEDIRCVALSMGQVHKAVPLTLALCLGAAARTKGTLAWEILEGERSSTDTETKDQSTLIIGHPSGKVDVGTTLDPKDGTILSAELHRTARVLMEGKVFY